MSNMLPEVSFNTQLLVTIIANSQATNADEVLQSPDNHEDVTPSAFITPHVDKACQKCFKNTGYVMKPYFNNPHAALTCVSCFEKDTMSRMTKRLSSYVRSKALANIICGFLYAGVDPFKIGRFGNREFLAVPCGHTSVVEDYWKQVVSGACRGGDLTMLRLAPAKLQRSEDELSSLGKHCQKWQLGNAIFCHK